MKKSLIPALILSVFLISGCKKNNPELIAEELSAQKNEKSDRTNNAKCDYQQATSKARSDDSSEELPLFAKYYNSTGKLERIKLSFLENVGGAYMPGYLNVLYRNSQMILLAENNIDTAAIFYFDDAGRIIRSLSVNFYIGIGGGPLDEQALIEGRALLKSYVYAQGRIKEIKGSYLSYNGSETPPFYDIVWYTENKFDYDGKKNISKISFFGPSSELADSYMNYTYDYSKKAKFQFYADERLPRNLYFLKYLNLFPELNPENILLRSYWWTLDYPGKYDRRYSDHKFDIEGKLVYYQQDAVLEPEGSGSPRLQLSEKWTINWKCFNGLSKHHFTEDSFYNQ